MSESEVNSNHLKRTHIFTVLCIVAFSVMLFITGYLSVNSADDYWYSEFMSGSMAEYFELMKYHYLTFNGRMIVHFFAQLILHFGHLGFGVASVLFCFFTPLLAAKLFKLNQRNTILSIALFQAFILILPHGIMINAYLWVSAFANYAIPPLFIIIELLFVFSTLESEKPNKLFCTLAIIGMFICGATTEQNGLSILVACIIFYLVSIIKTKKHIIFSTLCTVACITGVATIFLSPATFARMSRETTGNSTHTGFLGAIFKAIDSQAEYFSKHYSLMIMIVIFFAIMSYYLYIRIGNKTVRDIVLCTPALLCFGILMPNNIVRGVCYVLLLLTLILPCYLYFKQKQYHRAMLCTVGLSSIAVMIFTQSNGDRTFLPFAIYLFVVCGSQYAQILEGSKIKYTDIFLTLSLVSAGTVFGISLPHYIYNYRYDNLNLQKIEEGKKTGVIEVSTDYDKDYTYNKFDYNIEFYTRYKECNDIDTDKVKYYISSVDLPLLFVNGERCSEGAFRTEKGELYLPLYEVLEKAGGVLSYNSDDNSIDIWFNGRKYKYEYDRFRFTWIADNGAGRIYDSMYGTKHYSLTFNIATFKDVFGLDVQLKYNNSKVDRIDVYNKEGAIG